MREKAGEHVPAGRDIASDLFDQFVQAGTFRNILLTFHELCEHLELKPSTDRNFYHHLKTKVTSWKAKALWTKIDKRAMRKEYKKGKACANTRVLVVGSGPCGLRVAIECAFLGAKTVIVEKRDSFSRNNVLHLWPFLINDLRNLGAKKFFGKFCAGAIDHISIRQLQCILTKVALILGVEIHANVGYEGLEEPPEDQQDSIGWRAQLNPKDHPVSEFEFDVICGADGSRNALTGFKRKEFRGKLAIAITANFINRHSQAEARVEEISGVAFIFNQKFFQDLKRETGIDLENIVYYKDDTHYFVMTAKKQSLLAKGVIRQDHNDVEFLLSHKNVDQERLQAYARQAANFSTNNQLPHLDFAINHYGLPDVAMFDFTSLFQAEYAARIIDRNGHRLLMSLMGDSLLEPFWPTGSGCARGFLGCFDAAWMIRSWAAGVMNPLEVLAERESIYRLLAQTTPENLAKDYDRYGITPTTRYPHVITTAVKPHEVLHLYDTKDPDIKKKFEMGSRPASTSSIQLNRSTSVVRSSKLLFWCQRVTDTYVNVNIKDMTTSWKNGLALCAIIHRYRPDLIDFDSLQPEHVAKNNQLAFDVAEREFGISPAMTGTDMANLVAPDKLTMVYYVSRIYDLFKDELPPVLRTQDFLSLPILEENEEEAAQPARSPIPKASFLSRLTSKMRKKNTHHSEKLENKENLAEMKGEPVEKEKEKKRSTLSSIMSSKKHKHKDIIVEVDMEHKKNKLLENIGLKERQEKETVVGLSYKKNEEADVLDVGVRGANRVSGLAEQLQQNLQSSWGMSKPATNVTEKSRLKPYEPKVPVTTSGQCFFCNRRVYVMERLSAEGLFFHRECFRCQHCNCMLRLGNYSFAAGESGKPGRFFCRPHYYLWGNNPATQHLARKRPSTEPIQPPVPPIQTQPIITTSIPEGKPISPVSPTMLANKDNLLSEPINKKYRATPERIELENMRVNIKEMSEEELAKYNLGDYSNEESCSDDSDSEEIVLTRKRKSRKLQLDDEDEADGDDDEDDEDDDDEDYEEEDENVEDEEELETDEEDEISDFYSESESDISSSSEEEEEEVKKEEYTPVNHIRSVTSLKAQWLSNTSAPHIKSPDELEKERKEKEEKERLERERKEQKQREKEERRRIRQEKKDAIRLEKERKELEALEEAKREQEREEEERRKQEEWERKMAERDRLDEEERERKLREADMVDTLGVNGIDFADSDMDEEDEVDEDYEDDDDDVDEDDVDENKEPPVELKRIKTPGPPRWRDNLAQRYASYEEDDDLAVVTSENQDEKPEKSLTDDEKASLKKEELLEKDKKVSPKVPPRKLLVSGLDESDNDDVTKAGNKTPDEESESLDDNKMFEVLKLEEDEGLPDERITQKESTERKVTPYMLKQQSYIAVDDEDYDDLGEDSPMEFEDAQEDLNKFADDVDNIRKDGDGESEHAHEEGETETKDEESSKDEDMRLRTASATTESSFTISTPTGSVTSLSSFNLGNSLPHQIGFDLDKDELVDLDTPVIEAYNPPGISTTSVKDVIANPSDTTLVNTDLDTRTLEGDQNDADTEDVLAEYRMQMEQLEETETPKTSVKVESERTDSQFEEFTLPETDTKMSLENSTPLNNKKDTESSRPSTVVAGVIKTVSDADNVFLADNVFIDKASPKHGNRNFNNAVVSAAEIGNDENTGSESAGEFVMGANTIQPSMIKSDTLKHKKNRRSSGSGTARIRSDKVKEQKGSPRGSPMGSPSKRLLPKVPSAEADSPQEMSISMQMKRRGEILLREKAMAALKDRPRAESEPVSGQNDQNMSNVSSVLDDSRTRSQSDVTDSFHTPTGHLTPVTPSGGEKSPVSDTPMQFSGGVPKSESKSKEKKSRLSLIRRDKKDIKRRNAVRSSAIPDDVDVMATKTPSTRKLLGRKSKKKSKRKGASSQDELEASGGVDSVDGAKAVVFPEPDILVGLQSRLIPESKLKKPPARKQLSVDPLLTGDLDDTTTDEEEVAPEEIADDTPTTSTKDKGGKKGKSPRRIWGKKFKRIRQVLHKRSSKVEKEPVDESLEKRKLEEEELTEKLTRRVQKEARRQHKQQQQKRLRMAQEIQRQLTECEVKQRQLEERGIEVEKSLRGESKGAEGGDENTLMQQWFSLVNEKNALVRYESELMVQARELELEDRHSALEQELRQRMAVDEEKKTEADREAEKLLLEEIVEVVEQRDALVALLEEERVKEDESSSNSSSSDEDSDDEEDGSEEEEEEVEDKGAEGGQ
ncbi:uncharacterized protein [Amphiura filiformis]|uniref:uncharacterized protein isoform X4 n=1 Tax=Amphiura filiformis TaxID=82378 RepID=UPI003B20E200